MDVERSHDYIVVGAGAAGCVVARRLLDNTDASVLLLEAGGPDEQETIHRTDIPSMTSMWGSTDFTWPYATVPQPTLNDREVHIPQGKVLGGGTSVNAMMYVRGNRRDFDHWNFLGNEGWSYRDVLPYFRRSENFAGGASEYRGTGGPLDVIRYSAPSEVSLAFAEGVRELGFDGGPDWDYNGAQQENAAFFYQSTRTTGNRRCSTATAFIDPVRQNSKLTVVTGATATRVLLSGYTAVGVEYVVDGTRHTAGATAEVVVCCGALASPKLLMLSGIGPAEALRGLGIDIVVDLPGVGRNLQDHMLFGVGYQSLRDLPFPQLLSEAGLFVHTRDGLSAASPDLQFFFGPVQFVDDRYRVDGPGFTFAPILARPHSRGTVSLRSADPRDLPVVDPQYLTAEADVDVLVHGISLARELVGTTAFRSFRGRELAPGDQVTERKDLVGYVRDSASTVWHPVGTCKMGADREAVVNSRLQTYGVDRLRVADASVMPTITAGNTNAATIMIAEKAAELIIEAAG